jgi:methionyl-tRNA synthetase
VEQVLYAVLESVRLSAYLLSPIVPDLSQKVYQQLGFSADFNARPPLNDPLHFDQHAAWGILPPKQALQKAKPIFPQLELSEE